jgi:3'-5' exoribonuclease
MKKFFVKDLKAGMEFSEIFVLRKKELKEYDGQKFLKLELGDKTGRIDGVLWEEAQRFYTKAEIGEVIRVKGTALTYREALQIKIDTLQKTGPEEVDPKDFLPSTEKDLDLLFEKFKNTKDSIENPFLRKLLDLFGDDFDLMQRFKVAPGGKLWHHSYLGGLLEHTLNVVDLCTQAAKLYELMDKDLLIAGALLHDIGKISQYQVSSFIDYSDEGRLVGHVVSGYELVSRKIEQIKDFPEELSLHLKHLILSHQGELELASPVVPQTMEAIILHYADEMDAKAGAFAHIIKKQKTLGKKWSDWIPLIKRYIYFGEERE